jgi:hypothetical protein
MAGRHLYSGILAALVASISVSASPIVKRNPYTFVLENPYGDAIFELGNVSYLANTKHPKVVAGANCKTSSASSSVPITVIKTDESAITKDVLEGVLSSYLDGDDVFSYDFLDGLYISSSVQSSLDASAIEYLSTFNTNFVFLGESVSADGPFSKYVVKGASDLPAGPYLASLGDGSVSLATVYRLYPDTYRTFLFGSYDTNDGEGNHSPLGVFLPKFWDPMIP